MNKSRHSHQHHSVLSRDITKWSLEELESEIVKTLPRDPELEHLFALVTEHNPAPPVLYHYTTEAAVRNILCGSQLWAFDAYSMKDRFEVKYPCTLLRKEILRSRKYFRQGDRLLFDLCSVLSQALIKPKDCYPDIFVFCLTENTKSERHWKAFASDKGYALAFNLATPHSLGLYARRKNNNRDFLDTLLRQIEYDPTRQREMLADVTRTFVRLFAKTMVLGAGVSLAEPLPIHMRRTFVESFKEFASRVVVSIKRPQYRDEREWRVIVAPLRDPVQFLERSIQPVKTRKEWIKTGRFANKVRKYVPLFPDHRRLLPLSSVISGSECSVASRTAVNSALAKVGYSFDTKKKVLTTDCGREGART
jgi:hypothetical protein